MSRARQNWIPILDTVVFPLFRISTDDENFAALLRVRFPTLTKFALARVVQRCAILNGVNTQWVYSNVPLTWRTLWEVQDYRRTNPMRD